jgi:hypothetical protein
LTNAPVNKLAEMNVYIIIIQKKHGKFSTMTGKAAVE